jgi:mono/diheme cytochrome c family protein
MIMTRHTLALAILMLAVFLPASVPLAAPPAQSGGGSAASSTPDQYRALLDQYCVTCHNQRAKIASLALDTMNLAEVGAHPEIWEKAVRKLRGSLMPPPGNRQPDRAAVESLVAWLEGQLDRAAAGRSNPGTIALHRLNRAEYAASIRELFDIEVDATNLLPPDDTSEGFDNIADVLKVSPTFMEQYITAARAVSIEAVGMPQPGGVIRATLRSGDIPDPGDGWAPLGTQGVMLGDHFFPGEGDYEIRGGQGQVITLDGARVAGNGRIHVTSGVHRVGVSSTSRGAIESEATLQALNAGGGGGGGGAAGGRGGRGGGGGVQITGPYNPVGPVLDAPNRRRLFVCRPAPSASESDELKCATQILSTVARRAFRRPVTDKDLASPLSFYKDGRARNGFEAGIQAGLMPIIASPKFLYRAEPTPANVQPGAIYKVGDLELASRLSFFLWSQIPDDELLDLAIQGRLSDPATLERQVRRMLADPRSKSLVNNFAFQWLRIRELDQAQPDSSLFPNFDAGLKQAMRKEIELFIDSVFRENHSVVELLTADYTFVNERLAEHYGIEDVRGPQFRRVRLTEQDRWGLLGKGAVLVITSFPNRTSIVRRGAWVLENIVGTPPAPPPPDVEAFQENKAGEKTRTIRQIMEDHRSRPTCNGCHGVMDPPGFALEKFDAIGEYRTKDRWAQAAIDPSGKMADGTPLNGPADLHKVLAAHPDQFVQTLTEKMMMYALGRNTGASDMPTVRQIVRDAGKEGYRLPSIVMGIVKSPAFLTQRAPEAAKAGSAE